MCEFPMVWAAGDILVVCFGERARWSAGETGTWTVGGVPGVLVNGERFWKGVRGVVV